MNVNSDITDADYRTWPEDIDKDAFLKDTFTLRNKVLATRYGRSYRNIQYLKALLEREGYVTGSAGFPKPAGRVWNDYLQERVDRFLVMGDFHIPSHDPNMLIYGADLADHWGIDKLFINGDFVSNDAVGPHKKLSPHVVTYAEQADIAKDVIRQLLKGSFKEIYILKGNHERWLNYGSGGQIDIEREFIDIDGCRVSQYPYALVESAGEMFKVGHPGAMSKLAGGVPRLLSAAHKFHLITGHTHMLNISKAPDGVRWTIESGHCLKEEYVEYKCKNFTTYGMWNKGFIMVWDAMPVMITPENIGFWMSIKPPKGQKK